MQGQHTQVVKGQFAMSNQLDSLHECQQLHQEMVLQQRTNIIEKVYVYLGYMFYQC